MVFSQNLAQPLRDLLNGSTITEINWAALGPDPQSWVINFRDVSNTNTVRWGSSIPPSLITILKKTWHTPHLRLFLGPKASFFIWHPELIRWAGLPLALEETIQSWLTPSGWKVGPPRLIAWGLSDAFFVLSEYGTVAYGFGIDKSWTIYRETIEEWKAEKSFAWSSLEFITLDPSSTDQFVAIRKDGTWAGSIDDVYEDALETFASNYFFLAKSKPKTSPNRPKPSAQKPYIDSDSSRPDAGYQKMYEAWSKSTASLLASASAAVGGSQPGIPSKLQTQTRLNAGGFTGNTQNQNKLLSSFPYLPSAMTTCGLLECQPLKSTEDGIRACRHDVQQFFQASGLYSYEWLRQERLRWHPDRFGRLCEESWKVTGRKQAEEMFKVIHVLMEDLKSSADKIQQT